MYKTPHPTGTWKRVFYYQDGIHTYVPRLYATEGELPWIGTEATAILKATDGTGLNWIPFDKGLPGNGSPDFKPLQDTLFASYGEAIYFTTNGLEWSSLNAPGLRPVWNLNCAAITEHQGALFVPVAYENPPYFYPSNSVFIRPLERTGISLIASVLLPTW
ncbi:MAG: hypothetical protein IPH12_01620 [Saprospirales bacterium]|nr:hypothetical protein [Saprospirales bacterium]